MAGSVAGLLTRQEKRYAANPRHYRKREEPKRDSDHDRDGNYDGYYGDHR